jgi:PAS domain S-box-containing protein
VSGGNSDLVEFIADERGILLDLSPNWQAVSGLTVESALGTRFDLHVWPDDREAFRKELESLLRGESDQIHQPLRLLTRSGLPRCIELRAAARVAPDARRGDIFGAFLDVESRMRPESALSHLDEFVENQVAEHKGAVEDAKTALDGFIHTVAHDLRAPLRAIQGYARILQGAMGQDGAVAQDCVTRLEETASRMAAMFEGLLRLSHTGNVPLAVRETDCAPLIRGVIADVLQQPTRQAVTFVVDVRCVCQADPDLLRQVFVNLIGNAVKYSSCRAASRIEVRARREGPDMVFTVRDNGVGFDMAHAGKLFHLFQRLHARSEFEGCGVGLSIVRRIVERHGGRAWAEAVDGEGAAFHFSLPMAAALAA